MHSAPRRYIRFQIGAAETPPPEHHCQGGWWPQDGSVERILSLLTLVFLVLSACLALEERTGARNRIKYANTIQDVTQSHVSQDTQAAPPTLPPCTAPDTPLTPMTGMLCFEEPAGQFWYGYGPDARPVSMPGIRKTQIEHYYAHVCTPGATGTCKWTQLP